MHIPGTLSVGRLPPDTVGGSQQALGSVPWTGCLFQSRSISWALRLKFQWGTWRCWWLMTKGLFTSLTWNQCFLPWPRNPRTHVPLLWCSNCPSVQPWHESTPGPWAVEVYLSLLAVRGTCVLPYTALRMQWEHAYLAVGSHTVGRISQLSHCTLI